jgi:hypothetical protein
MPARGPLEAQQAAAGVDATAGAGAGNELLCMRVKALELVLGRLATAAGAGADRARRSYRASSSLGATVSIGTPPVGSSST